MWRRSPRSSSRNRRSVPALTTALVTSSLASSTARSTTVASGWASSHCWQVWRTKARAHGGGGGGRCQPQLVAQVGRPGGPPCPRPRPRSRTPGRKSGTWSRPRVSATCDWAPHNAKLVRRPTAGGMVDDGGEDRWRTTGPGGRRRTGRRSAPEGWSPRPLSRVRWTWEALEGSMPPVKATTRQPGWVARWISMAHPAGGRLPARASGHQRSALGKPLKQTGPGSVLDRPTIGCPSLVAARVDGQGRD